MIDWNGLPRPILALSPMADMTDSAFCRVVREVNGPDDRLIVFREMVSAEAVVRGNEKTLGMSAIHTAERPLVQQLFGSDPAVMAEATRIIDAQHGPEGFDINMGCPVYKIVHTFNGAALMQEPDRAAAIVRAMVAATPKPVSVKIRLGWSDPTDCLTFVRVLEDAGASMITIHGRTKTQGYSGVADWTMVGRAKANVQIPVLVNGDIHRPQLLAEALRTSGCDGALIARGALGNPWFFRDAAALLRGETPPAISSTERLQVILHHLDLHIAQGERLSTFRKHLSWYLKGLPNVARLRDAAMHTETVADMLTALAPLHQTEHPST